MTSDNDVILSVDGLFKVFGRRTDDAVRRLRAGTPRDELEDATAAVIDATFDVRRGEIFVVMGLSGSGKSTLIRMLNGLHDATAGTITIDGEPLTGIPATRLRAIRRDRISMVFQHFALLPHRTVAANVAYPLELQGMDRAERLAKAEQILRLVGLEGWGEKYPSQLSGGMQQRVGIARALAADTDILLMDEAFSALDPLIRREMQRQLLDLHHKLGKTIVFITHDLNEAMLLGDRIAVMRAGRIVQIGTSDQILTDPADDYVEQFMQDVDRARVLTASNVMQPPRPVARDDSDPRTALRLMREAYASAAFVVDGQGRLLGTVTDADVMKLVRKGGTSLAKVVKDNAATVLDDQMLIDMFVTAIESPLPLAVLDRAGVLQGVISRVTLLAALGPGAAATGEMSIIHEPVPTAVIDQILSAPAADETASLSKGIR